MARHQGKPCFVLSAQQSCLTATHLDQQPICVFRLGSNATPPFAWIGRRRLGTNKPGLPFARVGNSIWQSPASADSLMKQLLSEEPDEPQGPKRGHTDEWYQQRCIFCANCKATINSHYQKRGSRCQGCRRWFHAACMPATSPSGLVAPGAAAGDEDAAAAGAGGAEGQTPPTEATSSSSRPAKRRRNLFFHDDDCEKVFEQLARVAAAGEQPFTLPDPRPFWEKLFSPQPPFQHHSWRLLDLSEVKAAYKDAQKRDTLFKQHRKAQRQLEAAAQAAADREAAKRKKGFGFGGNSSSSSSSSTEKAAESAAAGGGSGGVAAAPKRSVRLSALDDFLLVSEVLKPLGETPRDLLEDSWAIITRDGSEGPSSVATFNVYGSDHARLQGVATPSYLQKQGHATRLVQQLELALADAGVQDLVVILEPQADDKPNAKRNPVLLSSESAQHWFRRRLGFKSASSEQQMVWRRDLSEYHKGLIGGCSLLVKAVPLSKAGGGQARSKKA